MKQSLSCATPLLQCWVAETFNWRLSIMMANYDSRLMKQTSVLLVKFWLMMIVIKAKTIAVTYRNRTLSMRESVHFNAQTNHVCTLSKFMSGECFIMDSRMKEEFGGAVRLDILFVYKKALNKCNIYFFPHKYIFYKLKTMFWNVFHVPCVFFFVC